MDVGIFQTYVKLNGVGIFEVHLKVLRVNNNVIRVGVFLKVQ